MAGQHFIGLISGTSRDGIDAVVVRFEGDKPVFVTGVTRPYPPPLREALGKLPTDHPPSPALRRKLDAVLAERFAAAARSVMRSARLAPEDVAAIGSHGQTIWHAPDADPPLTIQAGDGAVIAARTGITTVSDFRQADVAAGGQGAPLAPLIHRALFHDPKELRAVINIGGIANITLLEPEGHTTGFDSGPGNCLMDAWIARCKGQPFDDKGEWARSGRVDRQLLATLMADPYLKQPPPKSTGIETYHLGWLEPQLPRNIEDQDVQATLCAFTAHSIAHALETWSEGKPERILVCGGGAHNVDLMRRLAGLLKRQIVESTGTWGLDPDWVEGVLFAWLARERLMDRKQNTPSITGAREPVLLGDVHPPG